MLPGDRTLLTLLVTMAALCPARSVLACGHGGGGHGGGGHGGGHGSSGSGSHGGAWGRSSGAGMPFSMPDLGPVERWPVELAAEGSFQSLSFSDVTVNDQGSHSVLSQFLGGTQHVGGQSMGLGSTQVVGTGVRLNFLVAGHLLLGLRVGYGQQVNSNGSVAYGTNSLRLDRGTVTEGGVNVGGLFPLGPVTLRGEVYAGLRASTWTLLGLGNAGCDSPPVLESDQWVIQPRVELDWNLTRAFSVGAYASTDVLHRGEVQSGLVIALHGHPFSTAASPEPSAPAPAPVWSPPPELPAVAPVAVPGAAVPAAPVVTPVEGTAVDAVPDTLG